MATNVIPFRRPAAKPDPLKFNPGVVPFDRGNPAHVRAWNTMFALGWSELKARQEEEL